MPFRSIEQHGVLTSDDLDFLQDVYEAAVAGVANVDDVTMHEVVSTLITHFVAGERDREKLIAVAVWDMRRSVG